MINLHFLLQNFSSKLHTSVCQYSLNGEKLITCCAIPNFQDPYSDEPRLYQTMEISKSQTSPLLCCVNQQVVYQFVPLVNTILCIGPLRLKTTQFLKYHITSSIQTDKDYIESLLICDLYELREYSMFLFNLFHETTLDNNLYIKENLNLENTLFEIQQNFNNIVFENHELENKHNPYEQELREFSSIEDGDIERLKKSLSEDYTGSFGVVADNLLRRAKNLGIVVITLASRAAIRGGLLPEIAFSLADSYMQKLEKTDDFTVITYLICQAEFQYTELVHELKKNHKGFNIGETNPKIRQCKDYIFSHLHGKIVIYDIANELNINPSYLSEIFRKHEGVTINKFIINEKIKLTKNLLIYSQYSYIEIANYLGFVSQSHLGRHFKNTTGYTLKQFRDTFQVQEFIKSH